MALWYIFVVFVFCVIIPPMMWLSIRFCQARLMPLIVVSALVYMLPVPRYVYLDRVAHFMIFFVLGGALTHRWPRAAEANTSIVQPRRCTAATSR